MTSHRITSSILAMQGPSKITKVAKTTWTTSSIWELLNALHFYSVHPRIKIYDPNRCKCPYSYIEPFPFSQRFHYVVPSCSSLSKPTIAPQTCNHKYITDWSNHNCIRWIMKRVIHNSSNTIIDWSICNTKVFFCITNCPIHNCIFCITNWSIHNVFFFCITD